MRAIYSPSVIEKAIENKLWEFGIVIFDTCAILDFYYMTREYQWIMADIFKYLSNRIWLPAHVMYEYEKNRQSAMMKPKVEKYQDKVIQNNHFVKDVEEYIELWKKQYYHPYIKPANIEEIKKSLDIIRPEIDKIKTIVSMEYQDRKQEINDIANNDRIRNAVEELNHGQPFTFAEIKEIIKEGNFRYANHIPPGYKDTASKSGISKYGDLILWKEIIRYAKTNKKDIIFVTNDVAKGDWVVVDETDKDKHSEKPQPNEIGNPRRELLAEFEEQTKQKIWFYKTADFIKKLEDLYKPKQLELPFYGKLVHVRDVLARAERDRHSCLSHSADSILISCNNCGELFEIGVDQLCLDWQVNVEDCDRGMGEEYKYESNEYCMCPYCNNHIDITLQVWEYPLGTFNMQNIEVEGGLLEEPIDLSNYIDLDDYNICEMCGEHAIVNEYGLCESCQDEFDSCMESDD